VGGMENHQPSPGEPFGHEVLPAPVTEDALDEVLAQGQIVQPAFLLHGEQRKSVHQHPGEDAHPVLVRDPRGSVHPHPLHPATGRVALEDVAGEVHPGQPLQPRLGPGLHPVRLIAAVLAKISRGPPGLL